MTSGRTLASAVTLGLTLAPSRVARSPRRRIDLVDRHKRDYASLDRAYDFNDRASSVKFCFPPALRLGRRVAHADDEAENGGFVCMSRRRRWTFRAAILAGVLVFALVSWRYRGPLVRIVTGRGFQTVSDVLAQHTPHVERRFRPVLERAGLPWPPSFVTLLAFKNEKLVEVWAGSELGRLVRLETYPILAASGGLGPKFKEGDRQVPEGIYRLAQLNPNSQFHLSLFVDYPNEDDLDRAKVPRDQMGGEIFVHGGASSIGCIAIGDPAVEEVFTLAALVPSTNRQIVISPLDFRRRETATFASRLPAVPGLYEKLRAALELFLVDGVQAGH